MSARNSDLPTTAPLSCPRSTVHLSRPAPFVTTLSAVNTKTKGVRLSLERRTPLSVVSRSTATRPSSISEPQRRPPFFWRMTDAFVRCLSFEAGAGAVALLSLLELVAWLFRCRQPSCQHATTLTASLSSRLPTRRSTGRTQTDAAVIAWGQPLYFVCSRSRLRSNPP